MELWLRASPVPGQERDVALDAQATHTVGELAGELGFAPGDRVILARTGEWLDLSLGIDAAGVRSGDLLRSDPPPTQPHARPGQWCVVVAGGPSAGRVIPLDEGSTVLGRSPQADVALEDPNLSRRHLRLTVTGDSVRLADENSKNGTFVHGARVEGEVELRAGVVVEAGDTALRLHRHTRDVVPGLVRDGRVNFSRPPRLRPPRTPPTHRLPAPPEIPVKRRIPLASALVPLVAAPVVAQSAGPAGYLVAALSPVMVGASYWEERRSGRKDHRKQLADFNAAVDNTAQAMAADLQKESTDRWADLPDVAELTSRATGPSSRLWERRAADVDFLHLRVGWADQPSTGTWTISDGGEPEARRSAAAVLDQHTVVPSTPVVIDLSSSPVVGIAGPEERVAELARWMATQAAVLHSPRDVVVAAAVSDASAPAWEWVTWLPHARPDAAPFSAHPLAVGDSEARGLVASLNDLVAARVEQTRNRSAADGALPVVLLVFDERLKVPRAAVAGLLESGPSVGVRVVWLGSRIDGLPGETQTILDARRPALTLTDVATGRIVPDAQQDRLSLDQAGAIARSLAGVRDATARARGVGQLPSYVSLPDLLGGDPSSTGVQAAWSRHDGSLAAPVGVSETGLFSVDVRRDGPHALLGGTTGAGKSEMLQTLVASLAAHIPPTRLTFLLVDYKGGAAFKDCIELPHVVGFVTDLDSHLVHRALVSLNAELHRRERVLAAAGAKDLIEMERKAPDDAPASLLLVVDEFATLAKELPEFVDGVVNVAQRGRSLGIHMLLATQRPAGAINDNIRANTNLRMALRMNDEADSQDVINAKSAAALPRSLPGRAFVRTGASELTEVQIGYAGGHSLAGGDTTPLRVYPLRRGLVERPTVAQVEEDDERPTDLQRVVAIIRDAQAVVELPEQPAPWLPPLPDLLPLAELAAADQSTSTTIGLVDVPSRQSQQRYDVDLPSDGHLLVVGASGSGKTTLLRTLALSLAQGAPADRLHLYALDFASRGLGSLEALPHCGAVINGDDVERVQRLFGLLERWMSERKRLFGAVGVSSLEEYQRSPTADLPLPRVVVLLDSYGGFASVFERIDYGARLESFPHLLAEGRPLGIHFVITADRPSAVPLGIQSSIPARIVLRLADPDDYAMLGLDARVARQAKLPPGRGFDQRTAEVQIALVGDDPAGDAQTRSVTSAGARLGERPAAGGAARIETLPAEVDLVPLVKLATPLRTVIGIGERDLAPLLVDLQDGHFLVAGPNRSGKSTALAALATALRAADAALEMHLLAPRRTPLLSLDVWTSVARGSDPIDALCTDLESVVRARHQEEHPIVVVIDDGHELTGSPADESLEAIARAGRDVGAYIVGASETSAAQRSYGGWISQVRKDRHGLLLQPDPDIDGDVLGARLPRGARHHLPGRGVLVTRYGAETVQVAALRPDQP